MKKITTKVKKVPRRFFKFISKTRLRKILSGTLAVLILITSIRFVFFNPKEAHAWWDDTWLYRKSIQVSYTGSTELTDYQIVLAAVDLDSLYEENKIQNDCDDIRFIDLNGNMLDYWIENDVDATDVLDCTTGDKNIFVKIKSIPLGGTTIYMYYGNPNAEPKSSADDTFVFYDGFENGLSKWDTSPNGSGLLVETDNTVRKKGNYSVKLTDNSSTGAAFINAFFDPELRYTIRWYSRPAQANRVAYHWIANSSTYDGVYIRYDQSAEIEYLDTSYHVMRNYTANTWYLFEAKVNSVSDDFDLWINNVSEATNAGFLNNIDLSEISAMYFRTHSSSTSTTMYIDDFMVLKLAETEPTTPAYSSYGSEEYSPGPIIWWRFDEAYGETVYDHMGHYNGTLGTGSSSPARVEESLCISGKCLQFDGTDDYVGIGSSIPSVKAVSFWIRPSTTTGNIVDLDGGTHYISALSGTISATGFDNPNIYVNGKASTTLEANKWQQVSVTTDTAVPVNQSFRLGYANGNYLRGFIDDFKLYAYARTIDQVKTDAIRGAGSHGSSANFGPDQSWLSEGLVGYWPMEEATGSATVDRSGNGNTGTLTNMQETGVADAASTTTTIVDTDGSLSSTDDVYNGMIVEITGGSCGISAGTQRTISDYTGSTNTITFTTALGSEPDDCGYIIKHQTSGKFGRGLSFDGTLGDDYGDDYIQIGDVDSMDGISQLSVSAWVKWNSVGAWRTVVSKALNDATGWKIQTNGSSDLHFLVSTSGEAGCSVDPNLQNDTWYHVTMVFDGTKSGNTERLKGYVDGVQQTLSCYGTIQNTTQNADYPLRIGATGTTTPSRVIPGSVDEVRIYNRALSPSEVSDLYRWAPGPILHYKFDEGSGTTAYDSSGNNNSGTLDNVEWTYGKYGRGVYKDAYAEQITGFSNPGLSGEYTFSHWIKVHDTLNEWQWHASVLQESPDSYGINPNHMGCTHYRIRHMYDGGNDVATWGTHTNICDTNWHHFSLTFDGSGTTELFIDGISEGTQEITAPVWVLSGGSNYLFRTYNATSFDDFRLYNYARTQEQIIQDMNAGHPAPGSPVGSALGHWKFDEGYGTTAYNFGFGGSTLNGTISGATWTNEGKFGKALTFNGTDDYVVLDTPLFPTRASLSGGFSYTAWIKTTDTGRGNIAGQTDATTAIDLAYGGIGINSEVARTIIYDLDQTSYVYATGTTNIADGNWHHITGTYNPDTGRIYIYTNGKLEGSEPVGTIGTPSSTTVPFYIGRNHRSGFEFYFDGIIDDLKVYNFALTPDQIALDYNQGAAAVWGAKSTDSSGNPSWSSSDEYCPPGHGSTCSPPVAEWKFDEKQGSYAYDTSGNNNTGTLINGPTWQHAGACKSGSCLEFDGSNDYVELGSSIKVDNSSQGTVAGWVYPRQTTSEQTILSYGGSVAACNGNLLLFISPGGDIAIDQNSNGECTPNSVVATDDVFAINTWNHFAFVSTGTEYKLYMNGKEQTLNNWQGSNNGNWFADTTVSETDISALGRNHVGGDWEYPLNGLLDNVQIFDSALTASQISWLYNRGAPVGHWKFDECSGTTVYDWAPGANPNSFMGNNGIINIGGSGTQTSAGTCSSGNTAHAWYNGRNGRFGASLNFDGTDDYVNLGTISEHEFSGDFSVSAWAKASSFNTWRGIFTHMYSDSNVGWGLVTDGDSKLGFQINGSGWNLLAVDENPGVDEWFHLVGIRKSGINYVYLNGVQQTATGTAIPDTGSVDTVIGRWRGDYHGLYFNGQIDDVRIYNYPLTESQIRNVMNEGAVRFGL